MCRCASLLASPCASFVCVFRFSKPPPPTFTRLLILLCFFISIHRSVLLNKRCYPCYRRLVAPRIILFPLLPLHVVDDCSRKLPARGYYGHAFLYLQTVVYLRIATLLRDSSVGSNQLLHDGTLIIYIPGTWKYIISPSRNAVQVLRSILLGRFKHQHRSLSNHNTQHNLW